MKKEIKKFLTSIMITIVIFLVTLILFKSNINFKNWFNKNILETTISFAKINEIYTSLFGNPIPFKEFVPQIESVFEEKLNYNTKVKYLNGVKLSVNDNYLVPSIEKGLIIFVGEKDEYGLCVIVQQVDSVETMYCNLANVAVKLYDYIDSGMLIGEVNDNKLILEFKDNNGIVDYEKYI